MEHTGKHRVQWRHFELLVQFSCWCILGHPFVLPKISLAQSQTKSNQVKWSQAKQSKAQQCMHTCTHRIQQMHQQTQRKGAIDRNFEKCEETHACTRTASKKRKGLSLCVTSCWFSNCSSVLGSVCSTVFRVLHLWHWRCKTQSNARFSHRSHLWPLQKETSLCSARCFLFRRNGDY